jgi:hypothetical protein
LIDTSADGLVVFVGAGASFDCSSVGQRYADWRPPLVTDLFDDRFAQCLAHYPLAQTAASGLRPALEAGPVQLEDHLRDYLRDSVFEHRRRQYWEIPLYLQDVLAGCSHSFSGDTDGYHRLVDQTLAHPAVAFVSFNYDTLLDRSLSRFDAIDSIDDYIASQEARRWLLFKPHGSVNWSRRIEGPELTVRARDDTGVLARLLESGTLKPGLTSSKHGASSIRRKCGNADRKGRPISIQP